MKKYLWLIPPAVMLAVILLFVGWNFGLNHHDSIYLDVPVTFHHVDCTSTSVIMDKGRLYECRGLLNESEIKALN